MDSLDPNFEPDAEDVEYLHPVAPFDFDYEVPTQEDFERILYYAKEVATECGSSGDREALVEPNLYIRLKMYNLDQKYLYMERKTKAYVEAVMLACYYDYLACRRKEDIKVK